MNLSEALFRRHQTEREQKYDDWAKAHKCCPQCGSSAIVQTLLGVMFRPGLPYEDNENEGRCGPCGWKGPVKELVPKL